MIETDAPYLLPRSLRPEAGDRRNEPAFLAEVARHVAARAARRCSELAATARPRPPAFFGLPGNRPEALVEDFGEEAAPLGAAGSADDWLPSACQASR